MRITIKKMEVMVPDGNRQMQGAQTAKIFERELERISERTGDGGKQTPSARPHAAK